MKPFTLIVIFLASALLCDAKSEWSADFETSQEAAQRGEKPMLLYFTASWCGPCQRMQATTLQDPEVTAELAKYVAVKIDIDEQPQIAGQFSISSVPNFLAVTPAGQVVSDVVGYRSAPQFKEWLAVSHADVQLAWEKANVMARELSALRQALNPEQGDISAETISRIYDFVAMRDRDMMKTGVALLKDAAQRDPALIASARTHPDLQVRIAASQVLANVDPSLAFDPWAAH